MWTVVGIIIRDPDADPSTYSQVVNTWLKRSGTLPLTLYLGQVSLLYDVPLSRTKPGLIKAILSVFYMHSSRWEDVTLTLYESPKLSLPRLGFAFLDDGRSGFVFHSAKLRVSRDCLGHAHSKHLQAHKFPGVKYPI